MEFPFADKFQRLQPVVFLGDEMLAKTRTRAREAVLQFASGVQHAIGPLCWRSSFAKR